MTEELFREDATLRECRAQVVALAEGGVILDRTVFYPLGGGQAGDSGVLQLADGMACRVPDEEALDMIRREVDDMVAVTDDEVAAAMRAMFSDTHNAAEGAGAASLAAALQQRDRWRGQTIGVTLCGGNVDRMLFARVLAGDEGRR